ncbi:MAG: PAS domain S-box protein, partial [Aureispira sp.]|nr:PAS domain S-box protein [Aureispira sp.]
LIGKVAIDVFLDKKANLLMNKESEARKLGKSGVYEIQLKKKDGQKIWVLISGAPYYDEENKVVGSVGIHLDITQRKNIAQEVRESKEKLQTILNTSLDAIITINESSIVVDWSPSAEKTFGYSSKEAIGRSLNELIIPKAMRHQKGMSHFMKTGEGPILNKRIELTAVRKSGEVFPIELSVSPIRVQGKYFFSSFCRDITVRKENEKALIDAKKTAEQARKVERQFLAHMSHEIRTPMNAVIGMTYLLGQSSLSQEQEDYLEALKFSADSLMGIISDILDLSKIEAGEIELEHRPFSLHHILNSLQKTYQFKIQEKNISVEISIDDRIHNQIIGDQTRMSQILGNLLSNASKFTTEGYIGVHAILEKNEEGVWIKFQVYDSGIGISKDNLEIIFDSFKQATIDTHREFGGTGLGLSIVRQLVELQGGKIVVKSELGKGTTFEVLLPFHDSGLPIDNREENTIHSNNIMSRLSTLDILIAEDNLINQKLITSIFSQWGISFDLASDGVEALDYSKCNVYDMIFMDINMPRMNGHEVVLAIKADPHNLNFKTPIVTLTAAALNEERKRMFEAGVYDFITKPFSPQQLQQTIVSCLDMSLIIEEELIEHINSKKDTNQLYDLTSLKQFSQGNPQFLQDMLQMFLEQTPKDLRAIKDGFQDNDWAKVQDLAHQMKSTLGTLGMLKEQEIVQEIEKNMKNKNYALKQNLELIENLISSCENVYHLLEEEKIKLAL